MLRGPSAHIGKALLSVLAGKVCVIRKAVAVPARVAVNEELRLRCAPIGAGLLRLLRIARLIDTAVQRILLRLYPDHRERVAHIEIKHGHNGRPFPL